MLKINFKPGVTTWRNILLLAFTCYLPITLNAQPGAEPALPTAPKPNVPSTPTFEVQHYNVVGNTILPPRVIDNIFTNATGKAVSLDLIRKAVGDLQLAYRERGFATVGVVLPQQQLTNATIQVNVIEGKLTDITVTGNKFTSDGNVRRALPSLHTNMLINSRVFQRELDLANANRDRQIYPVVSPGPDPGTSALELRVKDRFPLHAHGEVDNYNTPGTPPWRVNLTAQYNNLWQFEHQAGIFYSFSPQDSKSAGLVPDYFFNQPLISSYGAYYRLPIGGARSVQDQIDSSANLGYKESTHHFILPPVGPRPDFTIYASESSSDTGTKLGKLTGIVTNSSLLTINSQDSGQNLTINQGIGGRFTFPVVQSDNVRWSFSAGADWKRFQLTSFNTNNFFFFLTHTNEQGDPVTNETSSFSAQPVHQINIDYIPINFGVDYLETDKRGTTTAHFGVSYNFTGDAVASASNTNLTAKTKMDYAKFDASFTRDLKFYKDWSLFLHVEGQTATDPLISNEQIAIGGINSVRGYYEGDEYGDAGWFGNFEARTPYFKTRAGSIDGFVPVWLRATAFVDYGQRFLFKSSPGTRQELSLFGTGFGLQANVNNHFDARITVGVPLLKSDNTRADDPHVYFSIGGQF